MKHCSVWNIEGCVSGRCDWIIQDGYNVPFNTYIPPLTNDKSVFLQLTFHSDAMHSNLFAYYNSYQDYLQPDRSAAATVLPVSSRWFPAVDVRPDTPPSECFWSCTCNYNHRLVSYILAVVWYEYGHSVLIYRHYSVSGCLLWRHLPPLYHHAA